MKNKNFIVLIFVFLFILVLNSTTMAHEESPFGEYVTLLDENNKIIHQTATLVHVGDEYIDADNSRYKVIKVIGNTAKCDYVGQEQMPQVTYDKKAQTWTFPDDIVPVAQADNNTVAIYVTHSDESYIPGDGTESIEGDGGIYDVANAFAAQLKAHDFNVVFNDNNHNPHDINAYNRSRKTATNLLKNNPIAIFDVHRDAIPAEQYEGKVKGKDVTKIKLVVGRTNPNSKTNLEFAKKIKAVMDEKKSGLSNGIFLGKGDYNQDLSPRALLIEVGSHENDKGAAIAGVKEFADIIPTAVGADTSNPGPAKKPSKDDQGAGTTILIILVVLGAAMGGFYLLNKGPSSDG